MVEKTSKSTSLIIIGILRNGLTALAKNIGDMRVAIKTNI